MSETEALGESRGEEPPNPGGPPPEAVAAVATIGVFDGVHRGHRQLLELVRDRARALGLPSLVITFDPHPVAVLSPASPPELLTPHAVKLRLLAELGMDLVWPMRFSTEMAALEPGEFVRQRLLRRIRPRELWIGYDFRFGRGREGGLDVLREEGARAGFAVHQFGPVHAGGRVYSSTWVREALGRGAVDEAEELLGHAFILEGIVGRGRGDAARLLVPTANLDLHPRQFLPAQGVYTGWGEAAGALLPAVINIGRRPTLTEGSRVVVEVHLLDWEGDLRGRTLAVRFGARLRDEARFAELSDLQAAVAADVDAARDWHRANLHRKLTVAPEMAD